MANLMLLNREEFESKFSRAESSGYSISTLETAQERGKKMEEICQRQQYTPQF